MKLLYHIVIAPLIGYLALGMVMTPGVAKDNTQLRGSNSNEQIIPKSMEQVRFSFAPLVKSISPSVVNVYAARMNQQRRSPFEGDPFFNRFFGPNAFGRKKRPKTSRSLGSGVIIGSDGVVITNHHVIENATQVKIALSDGREFDADIVLIDKKSDLAILKVDADERFPAVRIGDSENLEVGDLVLAIGNPFGVGQTVTSGIVSALARSRIGVNDFGFFIQTDASINPGNSGGALVNMEGELVGINTAIFSRSGGSNGIGFAVPSNMASVVLQSVRQGSDRLLRPWVGAKFQGVTAEIADSLGLDRPRGALIAGISPESPAELAGFRLGDVVLEIDQKPVEHVEALGYRLATAGVGREVEVTVLSRNEQKTLNLTLLQAPEKPLRDQRMIRGRSPFTGATVANLSPKLALELGVDADKLGVIIVDINRASPAARVGFKPKDIVIEINGEPVSDTTKLSRLSNTNFNVWRLIMERGGRRFKRTFR